MKKTLLRIINKLKSKFRLSEVTKRKLIEYSKVYEIPGSTNLNWNPIYRSSKNYPNFQSDLEVFKSNLIEEVEAAKGVSYLKFGDGDYYFLTGQPIGSAAPGKRAISRPLTPEELSTYQENSKRADRYLCEIDIQNRKLFQEIYGKRDSMPAEYVYGLTANHWLTQLPFKVGLIGADKKMDVIRELMKFRKYQEYLGLEEFTDYIRIPQKYACDNLSARLIDLERQLQESHAQIFLVGVGHLKSGIMSELPKMKKAVYLDIGSGIDALAGLIDSKRPYFGAWENHRLRNDSLYSDVDLLQYESSKTIYLN